jgi:hypothetical protein
LFSGHGSEALLSVSLRQQLIDIAGWMPVDDPGEDVSQIFERVDIIRLTGLNQRGEGGPVFGAACGSFPGMTEGLTSTYCAVRLGILTGLRLLSKSRLGLSAIRKASYACAPRAFD